MHKQRPLVDFSDRTQVLVKEEFLDSSSLIQEQFSVRQHHSMRTQHRHLRVCSDNSLQAVVVCLTRTSQQIIHSDNKLQISKRKAVAWAVFLGKTNSNLKLSTSQPLNLEVCSINHNRQEAFLVNNSSRVNLQLVDCSATPQTLVQEVCLQINLLQEGYSMLHNSSSQVASLASNNNNSNELVDYLDQSLPLVVYIWQYSPNA